MKHAFGEFSFEWLIRHLLKCAYVIESVYEMHQHMLYFGADGVTNHMVQWF